ncbi:FHA domain-containing protein [Trujillonella endophytica]|uniref:FHA domain-containing protein n=1 Tax=Trujillonella endophytica TaxID=673521 RepID=A0A1H8QW89_9ACTN|nr:FHA domain-containing protein [Trujillella endophytica]SEO58251.1 FHA domain-containing protein [Trujillella endophytica]
MSTPVVPPAPAASPAAAVGVPPFDQVGVAVTPGEDLVVRLPGIVLVVAVEATTTPPAPAASSGLGGWGVAPATPAAASPAGDRFLGELVGLCRRVSAAGRRAPGRRLHEELRAWLPTATGVPSFAVASATEEGLALALLGDGVAEVPELGLRLTSAQGEDPLPDGRTYLDRLVDWPPAALRLSVGAPDDMASHPLADLEAGVVPGAAAVLSPAPVPATPVVPAPPAPGGTVIAQLPPIPVGGRVTTPPVPPPVPAPPPPPAPPAHAPAPAGGAPDGHAHDHAGHDHDHDGHDHAAHAVPEPPAPVVPPPPVELPAPAKSVSFLQPPPADEVEPPREPLPVVSEEQPPAALAAQEEGDTRPKVKGILCKNGHLNDPRVLFCAQCGIRTTQQTAVFVEGVRPPLGLLVFDNGATVSLDADYLLGREPETDDRVRTGNHRPLLVVDQTGGVSRHHAEIRLEGWDVVLTDIGSANGTLFARRGELAWTSLIPGQPVQLTPGMTVRMGGRQFAFESPHGGY